MDGIVRVSESRPRIFVVDDDRSVRESFLRQFRSVGWSAEGFATAAQFMQRTPYKGIGCLLLDVRLPDLQGSDLHSQIIARGIDLPVIFVSAFGDVPTAIAAIRRGAVDFLIKPVDETVLFGTIRQALARHAAVRYEQARQETLRERFSSLTKRQSQVLELVLQGHINKQIANQLGITSKTVKAHRGEAMRKMGFRSVTLLLHALEEMHGTLPKQGVVADSSGGRERFVGVRRPTAEVALLSAG